MHHAFNAIRLRIIKTNHLCKCRPPDELADIEPAMLTNVLDRRKSERFAVRTSAKIMVPQLAAPLDCIATNVSDGGAQIHIRNAELPEVFVLHFTETGRRRHCRVVWRQGAEIGVAFTDKTQVNFGRRVAAW
jgi:PilZ domain